MLLKLVECLLYALHIQGSKLETGYHTGKSGGSIVWWIREGGVLRRAGVRTDGSGLAALQL